MAKKKDRAKQIHEAMHARIRSLNKTLGVGGVIIIYKDDGIDQVHLATNVHPKHARLGLHYVLARALIGSTNDALKEYLESAKTEGGEASPDQPVVESIPKPE